jgi:hypothetical protein
LSVLSLRFGETNFVVNHLKLVAMKKTNTFIAFHSIALVVINYLFLVDSGLIFGKSLSPALLIFMCVFNFGNLCIIGLLSQSPQKTKEELRELMHASLLINTLFMILCSFYNCTVKTDYLIFYYLLGTFLSIIFFYYLNQAVQILKNSSN